MGTQTILNACNIPINVQQGSIPNVEGALNDWFQLQTFTLVNKATVAFQLEETATNITFWGIVQPLAGRQIGMKPEGQRKWNWLSVHAQAGPAGSLLRLSIDDVIIYLGTQYRVSASKNYAIYGYIYYELVQDYTGSGPG